MAAKDHPRVELQVGVFLLFGIILLGGLIIKFGDFNYWLRKKYPITVQFADAGNLVKGAPVKRGGVEIGRVRKNPYLPSNSVGVRVDLEIFSEYHISKGSMFKVATDGIIGDALIMVEAPMEPTGEMVAQDEVVDGTTGGLSQLQDRATQVADKSLLVMEDIRGSLKQIGKAMDKVEGDILSAQNLANFKSAMTSANQAMAKLDEGLLSRENLESVKVSLQKLEASATKMEQVVAQAGNAMTKLDKSITDKVNPSLDEFNKAAVAIRKAAEDIGIVAKDAHGAPGLVGAMLRDPELRNDFIRFAENLRKHGIWRYKDAAPDPAAADKPAQTPPKRSILPWKKG